MAAKRQAVYLLDADPDLADALDADTLAKARPYSVVHVHTVEAGPWRPGGEWEREPGRIGLLILDGILARDVEVSNRAATELLGPGDLVRPWDDEDEPLGPWSATTTWTALSSVRLAILDARFAVVSGRWPPLMAAIVARSVRRSRALAIRLALMQVTGVDVRLRVLFTELVGRWGYVRPDGVALRVRLTHETLARLVGARRPSVTTALRGLQEEGSVVREADDLWVLPGAPMSAG